MADQPIGVSFIPSAQNQAQGPENLRASGGVGPGGADLAQAYKILSLRLPTVVGASAPASPSLLNSPGASGLGSLPNGMNPYAAVFQALLKAMSGSEMNGLPGMDGDPNAASGRIGAPAFRFPQDPGIQAGSSLAGSMTPSSGMGGAVDPMKPDYQGGAY